MEMVYETIGQISRNVWYNNNYEQRENIWLAQTIKPSLSGLLHKFLKVERLFIMGYICVRGYASAIRPKESNNN